MTEPHAPAILVVEDDAALSALVADLLRDEGYAVRVAHDGLEAISAIKEAGRPSAAFSLVLLDMMLPRADGIDVLRVIGELGGDVPVVAMSADRRRLSDALAAGARTAVAKPFDLDHLIGAVEEACRPAARH